MHRALRRELGVVSVFWAMACSPKASSPAECTLPEELEFDFTKVTLDADKSNAACPAIDAATLDAEVLAEQGQCEQTVVDCVIELTCDYEGFVIEGRMIESDEQLTGRFSIESPFVCLYSVKAEWKDVDAGG